MDENNNNHCLLNRISFTPASPTWSRPGGTRRRSACGGVSSSSSSARSTCATGARWISTSRFRSILPKLNSWRTRWRCLTRPWRGRKPQRRLRLGECHTVVQTCHGEPFWTTPRFCVRGFVIFATTGWTRSTITRPHPSNPAPTTALPIHARPTLRPHQDPTRTQLAATRRRPCENAHPAT